ncbi:hypothetical protein EG329_003320 [Mollisiaceae sp. DMI_Dod_QoI]|nr:hypothetical protein EG329_003320 [Helotiales sp. DMI_Dod_QoI]
MEDCTPPARIPVMSTWPTEQKIITTDTNTNTNTNTNTTARPTAAEPVDAPPLAHPSPPSIIIIQTLAHNTAATPSPILTLTTKTEATAAAEAEAETATVDHVPVPAAPKKKNATSTHPTRRTSLSKSYIEHQTSLSPHPCTGPPRTPMTS